MSTMSCPSISLNPVGSVNEGSSFSLTGTVSPPGMYFFQANINWGQSPGNTGMGYIGTQPDGTFSTPHIYFDDGPAPGNGTPFDAETISLTATINGCPVSAQSSATVNNVAPVPQLSLTNTNQPQGGPRWQISGTIQDVGNPDQQMVTIDWGDGSAPTVVNVATNTYFSREHEYDPRQIHEWTLPFYPTVTVVDDDTGSALWEPIVPQYVLDLDNDANNDWTIDPADDPLEDTVPGRWLVVNLDDDNSNEIPDGDEEGPVSGEDDLEPFQVGWEPRPGFDYTGWHIVLTMYPEPSLDQYGNYVGIAKIYTSSDKTGFLPFEQTAEGPGFDWVVGTNTIPTQLYIEALGVGPISLQLSLLNPQFTHADEDVVLFTAADVKLRMEIGHGISFESAPKRAITVANLNDTDGDGTVDIDDNSVDHTIQGKRYMERDLMPLAIAKPDPYDPAEMLTLTTKSGSVKFWKSQTKEEEINPTAFLNDGNWGQKGGKLLWVEATAPSQAINDIELELRYKTVKETVWATAIWATQTNVEHDRKTPAQIFAAYPEIDTNPNHTNVRTLVETTNGTGLIPPGTFIHNGILIEFTVTPADFHKHPDSTIVSFDISRRMSIEGLSFDSDGNLIPSQAATCILPYPTMHPDATNDDLNNTDESTLLDKNNHMYVYDAPASAVDPVVDGYTVQREERVLLFEEFVRIDIKRVGVERPKEGHKEPDACVDHPDVDGSRASNRYKWRVAHTLNNVAGNMVRSTGDENESPENHVEPGN